MEKEAELKDHESLSRSTRDRRKLAGRREEITDEGIEGQGICGGGNDQTEERPGVSQIVLGGLLGWGHISSPRSGLVPLLAGRAAMPE